MKIRKSRDKTSQRWFYRRSFPSLTKVFEESQKAADLYLKNVKQMNGEAEYEKG